MKYVFWLFLFLGSSSHAQVTCAELFNEVSLYSVQQLKIIELASIYKNNSHRFRVNQSLHLKKSPPEYKTFALSPIKNIGSVNAGIYGFTQPYHGASVLKLYKFPEEKFGELLRLNENSTQVSKEVLEVVTYIRGNLLAQEFGAPKIYDSGFLKDGKDFYFYIEMERIFSGKIFFGVKEDAWKIKRNKELAKLLRKHPEIIDNVRNMFEELASRGIVPFDPDVAITKGGEIRWIDPDYWELGSPEQTYISMGYILDLLRDLQLGSIFSIY